MNEKRTDFEEWAAAIEPAAMPADMNSRLLAAMEQEDAEMLADLELEAELASLYTAAPMPPDLQQRLGESMCSALVYRRLRWWRAVAALLVAFLVLPMLWWGLMPERGADAPVVEVRREHLPADGAAPSMRRDIFVMQETDQSCLVIKVQTPVEPELPEDVI